MDKLATCTCNCHKTPAHADLLFLEGSPSPQPLSRSTIDQQIAALQARILELKTMRNNQAPVAVLPSEFLAEVLKEAVRPMEAFAPVPWKSMVQLSSVCKLWRKVTLDCAGFWSCVPIVARRIWLSKVLARSKQHPFSIRYDEYAARFFSTEDYPVDISPPALLLDIVNASRVRDLHMRANMETIEPYMRFYLARELPSLQSLDCWVLNTYGDHLRLPTQLFALPKPSLRHLRLKNCIVDWDAASHSTVFPISNLITLNLNLLHSVPPFDLLLKILTLSPLLQDLELFENLRATYSRVVGDDKQLIPLHHLQRMSIVDELSSISDLLSWIEPFRVTKTDITVQQRKTATLSHEARQIRLKSLLTKCRLATENQVPPEPYDFIRLQISPDSTRLSAFLKHEESAPHHNDPLLFDPHTLIQLTEDLDLTSALMCDLHAPGLQKIGVEFPQVSVSLDRSSWRNLFRNHPTVLSLYIRGAKLDDVVTALRSDEEQGADTPFLLPSLENLNLEAIRFEGPRNWEDCPQLSSLRSFLVDRANHSDLAPLIPLVRIERCVGFNSGMLEALQLLVPGREDCISWDGQDCLDGDEDYTFDDYHGCGDSSNGEADGTAWDPDDDI